MRTSRSVDLYSHNKKCYYEEMSTHTKRIQHSIHNILQNESKTRAGRFLEAFLFILIFFNVFLATLETVDSLHQRFSEYFFYFEVFSVGIFTIEYFLRVWTSKKHKKYSDKWGRLRFIFSPLMIFDLLVILPFYLMYFFTVPFDSRVFRMFRLLRIFRVFRVARYSDALERIMTVAKKESAELAAVFTLMMILLLISSTVVFMAENHIIYPGESEREFSSIPKTFWWGIATLTTIGYGDMVPVTAIGRIFGAITAIFGVAMFALPTGLIGASFYREVTARRDQKIKKMENKIGSLHELTAEHREAISELVELKDKRIQRLERKINKMKKTAEEKGVFLE